MRVTIYTQQKNPLGKWRNIRAGKEDAMWETAKLLVDKAIQTHMETFGVDRERASYWINSALGGV